MFLSVLRPSFNISSRRFSSQRRLLPYEIDRFNAAQVRLNDWPENTDTIREILSGSYSVLPCVILEGTISIIASLEQWRNDQRTSAWLWVPIEKSHVIPIAAELGKELMAYNDEISF